MAHIKSVWTRWLTRYSLMNANRQTGRERRRLLYEEADSVLEDLGLSRDQLRLRRAPKDEIPAPQRPTAKILPFRPELKDKLLPTPAPQHRGHSSQAS